MKRKKNEFRRLLQDASPTFQHVLRKAADIMEADGLTPAQLVAKGKDWRERRLITAGERDAGSVARRIPNAMTHLASIHPNAGLPVSAPAATKKHTLIHLRKEPRQLRIDLVRAWKIHAKERNSE